MNNRRMGWNASCLTCSRYSPDQPMRACANCPIPATKPRVWKACGHCGGDGVCCVHGGSFPCPTCVAHFEAIDAVAAKYVNLLKAIDDYDKQCRRDCRKMDQANRDQMWFYVLDAVREVRND